jgi:4-amino-4-deoxy-L-arabinose transferase-like glycosyltransferase
VSLREEEQTSGQPGLDAEAGSTPARDGDGALWRQRLRPLLAIDSLWIGIAAMLMGLHAQLSVTSDGFAKPNADTVTAIRWYILASLFLLIGWSGTYANESLLRSPSRVARGIRAWIGTPDRTRVPAISAAIVVNLLGILMLRQDWNSWPGSILWLLSLGLLVAAYLQERPDTAAGAAEEGSVRRTWSTGRVLEMAALAGILILALGMRLWRLGDLSPGMHGDEGEAGSNALAILNGNLVSPWARGWFNQSNVYYWSLAIFMKIFGTGLFGLRTFALVCGMLTVLFVYLIAREMFGVRVAVLAGFFMSFQSGALLFSRQEFSNVTIPALETASLYFLVKGLRSRRHLDFLVSGLIAGFAVYYFAGGRLIGPVALLFMGYLAVVHRSFLRDYWTRALAFVLGLVAIATPFAAYYLAYPLPTNSYPNDRFIWLHHADLAALYGTSDWRLILWDQLTRTLSVLTDGIDLSAMSVLDYPVARPLEAVLVVLGLVWAAWRWRDSRFALLSLWFWSSVLIGGVLTLDAPNLPRILGIFPVLALLIAIMLDHLWGLFTSAAERLGGSRRRIVGEWAGGVLAAGAVIVSGVQNKQLYIDHYLNTHTNTVLTAQAQYVQQQALGYHFYDLGAPMLYWTHGDNRFINPTAEGEDMANPPDLLPLLDNGVDGERDANFLIWQPMYDYLQVLQAYYPGGKERVIKLGDPEHLTAPLIGYVVTRQQIDRRRTLLAQYRSADGQVIRRREPRIGLSGGALPPPALQYPATATWDGALVAPAYDTYHLTLKALAGSRLTIDGVTVFPVPHGKKILPGTVVLAQGIHTVHLSAPLTNSRTPVDLSWSSSLSAASPIERRFLWDNHVGRSWLGETTPAPGGVYPVTIGSPSRRVDGFLGFRSSGIAFGLMSGVNARWQSVLTVHRAGIYAFQLNSLGDSSLRIDGKNVVHDVSPGSNPNLQSGQLFLTPGRHSVEVRYHWNLYTGYLELWWTPPGGVRTLFLTPNLTPPGPAVHLARAGEPPVRATTSPVPEPAMAGVSPPA